MKIKITIAKKRFLFNYARIVNMLSSSRTMMKIVGNQFAWNTSTFRNSFFVTIWFSNFISFWNAYFPADFWLFYLSKDKILIRHFLSNNNRKCVIILKAFDYKNKLPWQLNVNWLKYFKTFIPTDTKFWWKHVF